MTAHLPSPTPRNRCTLLHQATRPLGCRCATRSSGGYALVLTLVMLSLTAVMVGTLAQTSGSAALQAKDAERELQLKWAEASCRHVLVPVMRDRLQSELDDWRSTDDGQDLTHQRPASSISTSFELGGVWVVARMDDQQALPNLNTLLTQRDNGQPTDIQALLASQAGIGERLKAQPLEESIAQRIGARAYTSWGQLYPDATPQSLSGLNPSAQSPQSTIIDDEGNNPIPFTLWGNGTLNLWTASPAAVHLALGERLSPDKIARLLELRQTHRDRPARQLVQMLNLGPSERAAARLALTDQSQTHTLWLSLTPPGSQGTSSRAPMDGRVRHTTTPGDNSGGSGGGGWSLTVVESTHRKAQRQQVFRW